MRRLAALAVIAMFLDAAPAHAHFLWARIARTDAPSRGQLWFSETPQAGDAALIGKIVNAKAQARTCDQQATNLSLQTVTDNDTGALVATIEQPGSLAIEAHCDYGVIRRGEATFRLQYCAKALRLERADDLPKLATATAFSLDVVPRCDGERLVAQVLFHGRPAVDAELVMIDAAGASTTLQLNVQGECKVDARPGGLVALRARAIVDGAAGAGTLDGKPYDGTRYYTTVTLELPLPAAKPVNPDPSTAAELLRAARANRAVWEGFPGFSADVTAQVDGQTESGRLEIDADGEAHCTLPASPIRDWLESQMASLVQHRMPSAIDAENVIFADDETHHPLGRKIHLGHARLESAYRIKDSVVTEVNRKMGDNRFTISVLEVERNVENKYLPRTTSVTYWDGKTGDIISNQSVLNEWTRVDRFDLPTRVLEIEIGKGVRHVRQLELSNLRLPLSKER